MTGIPGQGPYDIGGHREDLPEEVKHGRSTGRTEQSSFQSIGIGTVQGMEMR